MKLSDSEWIIMNALWSEHPATARQIAERLPEDVQWAYTTIKTMLSRLVEKKAVGEEKVGNTSLYKPLLTQKHARKNAFSSLMHQAFDGAFGPMMHFLFEQQSLNGKQRQELMNLLKEDESKKSK